MYAVKRPILSIVPFLVLGAGLVASCERLPAVSAPEPPHKISAGGQAKAMAEPDRGRLLLSVESHAASADDAVRANARLSMAVVRRLEALVADAGTVSTRSYKLRPEYSWEEKDGRRRQVVAGYLASNTVQVETANLASLGAMIDAAVSAGSTRVAAVSFYLADPGPVRREAVAEATRLAQAQAEAIAETLGVGLGDLLEASTSTPAAVPPALRIQARLAGKGDTTTPISPGEIEIKATVSLVYEVE